MHESHLKGCGFGSGDVRLSVRVGLDTRLLGDGNGTPSLISSPSDGERPFGFGTGSFESGPARLDRTSKLERRRAAFTSDLKGEELPLAPGDVNEVNDVYDEGGDVLFMVSSSSDIADGELSMPGGNGRGPRRIVFSRLYNWACWCLIVCFKVDI